jgi:hypothetical protein
MRDLPHSITAAAFRATNGEFGWRRADIEQALLAIRDSRQATLGGEVWRIIGPGDWHGLIPDRNGGDPGVWSWDTTPRSAGESWEAYCERTASESIEAVRGMTVEQETVPEVVEHLRFNVCYVDETEA